MGKALAHVPKELAFLATARQAIAECLTVDDAKDIRDRAEAIRCYLKQSGESLGLLNDAAEIKQRAERRAGALLQRIDRKGRGRPEKMSQRATLTELGLTRSVSSRWQLQASVSEPVFERHVASIREAGKELTTASVLKLARRQPTKRPKPAEPTNGEAREVRDLAEVTGETFGTIYADPPWLYGNQATRAATSNHYDAMTVDQICEMKEKLVPLVAENAHLHLWTTNAFLPEAFRVIEAWGFTYKSCFVWVKNQMGIGNYWRVSHEFLLLGVKGKAPFANHSLPSWAVFPRGKHSAKPEEIRAMIERASPGPRMELFGRKPVEGWTVYGNQIERRLFA